MMIIIDDNIVILKAELESYLSVPTFLVSYTSRLSIYHFLGVYFIILSRANHGDLTEEATSSWGCEGWVVVGSGRQGSSGLLHGEIYTLI